MIQLSVNIDHVATIRQARRGVEPDPLRAAHECELGGCDGITVHLREDRRHIHDHDVEKLRDFVQVRFNLEMAATDEMVSIARRVKPHTVMLVPEGRHELTTEGGLDVMGQIDSLTGVVDRIRDAGCQVSAFIDPDHAQVDAANACGFDVCEVHTGPYARAFNDCGGDFRRKALRDALDAVSEAGKHIREHGMRFNAGHALHVTNVGPIAALPGVSELHIGHSIVSRSVFIGLRAATREMKDAMVRANVSRGTSQS